MSCGILLWFRRRPASKSQHMGPEGPAGPHGPWRHRPIVGPQVESPGPALRDTGEDPVEHGLGPSVDGVGADQMGIGQQLSGKGKRGRRRLGTGIDGDQTRRQIGITDGETGLAHLGDQIGIIPFRAEYQVHRVSGALGIPPAF